MKEYIVTLKEVKDKESFCNDMVSNKFTSKNIPERSCNIESTEKFSPNVIFYLEENEADDLKKDPRVLDVDVPPINQGLEFRNAEYFFKKHPKNDLPISKREELSSLAVSGSRFSKITGLPEGNDVDVVILDDGHLDSNHPEFSVNSNGTGGSRVDKINWYQHTNNPSGTYPYSISDNHPCHVGGIAAGNTNGWAKKSNIYTIDYNWNNGNIWVPPGAIIGFHSSKAINSKYGNKNPTIVNMSFTLNYPSVPVGDVLSVVYRGQLHNRPAGGFSNVQLIEFGIRVENGFTVRNGAINNSYTSEISNIINNGIIVVAAAGNTSYKIDVPGGPDYNNYFTYSVNGTQQFNFYHRGSIGSIPGVVCVGALSAYLMSTPALVETKAIFSETGPRVDVYAPGELVQSSLNFYESDYLPSIDPRNSSFYFGKTNGTSMASPQVAGMLACRLQDNRLMTPAQARAFVATNSLPTMWNTFGWYGDLYSLLDGQGRVAFYPGLTVS